MEMDQPYKTSSVVLSLKEIVRIRDVLKYSNIYFEKSLSSNTVQTVENHMREIRVAHENCSNLIRLIEEKIFCVNQNDIVAENSQGVERGENSSYVEMGIPEYDWKNENERTECQHPIEYVDVLPPLVGDDENIYDNFNANFIESLRKIDNVKIYNCPFESLPATHLSTMRSPVMGWLMVHQRRNRFLQKFNTSIKKRYYAGIVDGSQFSGKESCNCWLLMYAGGMSDLKPTLTLLLHHFEIFSDYGKSSTSKRIKNKFELKEKSEKKDAKSYCMTAESPEQFQHWLNALKRSIYSKSYLEKTSSSREDIESVLQLNAHSDTNADECHKNMDTVDICESIYEEPEVYYNNISTKKAYKMKTSKNPELPKEKTTTLSISCKLNVSSIYDIPKPIPIQMGNSYKLTEKLDKCSTSNTDCITTDDFVSESSGTMPIDSVRSSPRTQDNENEIENSNINSKYQLNTMKKWFLTNHLARMRLLGNQAESFERGRMIEKCSNSKLSTGELQTKKQAFSAQPKGNKVHMIINQLEANGQLTLISGGALTNKNT